MWRTEKEVKWIRMNVHRFQKTERSDGALAILRSRDGALLHRGLRRNCAYATSQPTAAVFVFLFALGLLFSKQASGQGLQPDNRQSTLHGTVLNALTHEPIGRALVHSSDNRFAMLTDSEGRFEFTLSNSGLGSESSPVSESRPQPPGPRRAGRDLVWLMARKPGFLEGPNDGGQVQASPGTDCTIFLMPEALIKGRIILSGTDGAIGADVQVFSRQVENGISRWIPGATVQANSNGEFRVAGLRAGTYKLMTHELMDNDPADTTPGGQMYGFPPVYYQGAADFDAAGTIQLASGQTFEADLALARQPYYAVSVPVSNGKQDGGMRITVSVQGHRDPGYSLVYNSGKQRIEGLLPNGNYLVGAATSGSNPATGAVNITVDGRPVEGPRVVLARNGSISLHVKEEFASTDWSSGNQTSRSRGPRTYLQISAENADDFEERRGSMRPPAGPEDNSLIIDNLPPGRYWLLLRSSHGYVASATTGGADLLHEPLLVSSGATSPVEVTMRDDGAKIEGKLATTNAVPTTSVAAPNAAPSAPQAFVYCIPSADGPGQFQQFSVGADGRFTSPVMAPGTYRVMAFQIAQPALPYRDAEAMRAYDSKGQIVQLSPGQRQSVQLQIISNSD